MILHAKDIQRAIELLRKGGVGIFPTDTVYGIGCRIDDEQAIKKVFAIRKRPEEKAVLVVVDSVKMAQDYLLPIPLEVKEQLLQRYWPGGLTIILPCKTEKVASIVRANGITLAVRQTNHPILLQLIQGVGVPLIAPSANFAGEKTPSAFADIDKRLLSLVDFTLLEPSGGSSVSTIIDCSVYPWKILREGIVHVQLSETIGERIIYIDTSDNKKIIVSLAIGGKTYIKEEVVIPRSSQNVLPMIDELLKEHNLAAKDLTDISVAVGPGSFTGLRVGVAIANAFAFAMNIPVNGQSIKDGKFSVEPTY
ncbi:MAG TPA: L-threonylcarbamoyladenylate synthase [Patescibacteria group bacterium]|nr:L-threonylcarbamoyladenylate synthase [Patescibacteria group bacterium]